MKNWLLCVDLQVQLQNDSLPLSGRKYLGILSSELPSEGNIYADRLKFSEVVVPSKTFRRNVHLFSGRFCTVTLRPDGSPRLNLRNTELKDIDIDTFCLELMNEIRLALQSVIGKS